MTGANIDLEENRHNRDNLQNERDGGAGAIVIAVRLPLVKLSAHLETACEDRDASPAVKIRIMLLV